MRPTKLCVCGDVKKMTAHHVFPKAFFGKGPRNNTIYLLCWECHCEIHTLLPQNQKMPRRFYTMMLKAFIQEKRNGHA